MIGFDDITKENIVKHNPNCYQIPDRVYKTFVVDSSVSQKADFLLNHMAQWNLLDVVNSVILKFTTVLKFPAVVFSF